VSRGSALRPVVATAEVVAIGAVAHVGAGGSMPTTGHLVALVGLVAAVSLALHHRLVHVGVAAAVATLGQLLLHTLGSGAAVHAAHGAHQAAGEAGTGVAGWQMVLAHAIGAAVTVAALLWQEQLVLALAGARRPGRQAAPPSYDVPRPPTGTRPLGATTVRVLALAPHRGPPMAMGPAAS
jgi:hypothetical protein